jgi:hypothetical protein
MVFGLTLALWAPLVPQAAAQDRSRDLSEALSRLKNNPRYNGRVLGTYVRRDRSGYLYEVRILRPDDRIILVYIDPQTGGVVGDSQRDGARKLRDRREAGPNDRRRELDRQRRNRNQRQRQRRN